MVSILHSEKCPLKKRPLSNKQSFTESDVRQLENIKTHRDKSSVKDKSSCFTSTAFYQLLYRYKIFF